MRRPFAIPMYMCMIKFWMHSSVCSNTARSMFTNPQASGSGVCRMCFWSRDRDVMALFSGSWTALSLRYYRTAIVTWGDIFHCMTTSISWISTPIPAASMDNLLVLSFLLSLVIWYIPVHMRTLLSTSLQVLKYSSHKLTSRNEWMGLMTILRYLAVGEASPLHR